MKVLMLVATDVAHDSRVRREAAALAEAGHPVHVHGRDVPPGWAPPDGLFSVGSSPGGRGLKRSVPQPQGAAAGHRTARWPVRAARWWLLPWHRRRVWSAWARAAGAELRGRPVDVVHAHDFTALPLAAALAREQDALLVYDSHEWWSGRQRHGRPEPLQRLWERRREARLAAGADAVITVGEGIAGRLARWAGGPVAVVRNTFPALTAPSAQVPLPDTPAGVVYAGRIGAGRDLETVLAGRDGPLATVLVGPADGEYTARLAPARRGAQLLPALPLEEVDALLRRHGLAVVTLTDSCDNHRLALPNKLFHAVRAGVPVIAADLPELRRTVRRHDLGELYRPGDAASYRAAVRRAVDRYPELLRSVEQARAELSWEQDARRLVTLYEDLAAARRRPAPAVERT